jgi:hypothetical protein
MKSSSNILLCAVFPQWSITSCGPEKSPI